MTAIKTISIIVSGKVQGVYYRQSTRTKALQLRVTGKVKNNTDGTVSIMATGNDAQLDELVNWCKEGPPMANVTTVTVSAGTLTEFTDFIITK